MSLQETEKRLQNGPGFQYRVFWREAQGKDLQWKDETVASPPFLVNNTGTYTPFEIKVQAVNAKGKGPEPEPRTGHSGEDSMLSKTHSGHKTRDTGM